MCSNDSWTYLHVIALILDVGCVDGVIFLLAICEGQMSCITLSTLTMIHILNCLSTVVHGYVLLLLMVIVIHTH